MSAHTTKSITWLWIASLFVATVGVSGQQIYCYCMGKTTFELFANDDACTDNLNDQPENCCAKAHQDPLPSCCEKKNHEDTSKGCTKKTTKVFQLKTEFTIQEKLIEKKSGLSLDQIPTPPPFPIFCKVPDHQNGGIYFFAQPPPTLSGRMICVRYGVFRC